MKRTVVFVTPTVPSFRGNGLAMRAAATLHLLAASGAEVYLLIVPIYGDASAEPDADVARLCRDWRMVTNRGGVIGIDRLQEWSSECTLLDATPREWQNGNAAWQADVTATIQEWCPDLVFVFRFYLAPFVEFNSLPNVPVWLDVDELESTARARLSHLKALAGDSREAFELRRESLAYEKFEVRHLPSFERLFAASESECENVRLRCPGTDVRTLRNVYPKICPQPAQQDEGPARLLLVGSFGHYPNLDAARYFVRDILPSVLSRSPRPVQLQVIGSGLAEIVDEAVGAVSTIGSVPDTSPYYAACHLCIVPLRAGGGTRIKILEAFSHSRAVVSSRIGAEGLDVTDGVHLLIADDAEGFADRCLCLIDDATERARIAEQGHQYFLQNYTLRYLEENLPTLFGEGELGAMGKALIVTGSYKGTTGHDHHTRSIVRALHERGTAVELRDFPNWSPAKLPDAMHDPWFEELRASVSSQAHLHFCMPHQVKVSPGLRNVNYTMFEASRIPDSWVMHSKEHDLVVVPAASSKEAWVSSGVPEEKVVVCPLGVDATKFAPGVKPLSINALNGRSPQQFKVRFLNVSDGIERKNLLGLLRAWLIATDESDDAALLLKPGFQMPGARARFFSMLEHLEKSVGKSLSRSAPVFWIGAALRPDEMPSLYAAATHYISVSHGEGFDLPMLEAGTSGLQLIAPRHTAYLDYLHDQIAYLIPSSQQEARILDDGPTQQLFAGATWWEPNHDSVCATIRDIIDDRAAVKQPARAALSGFSWSHTAAQLEALVFN